MIKLVVKFILNGAALYAAGEFLPGFVISGGFVTLAIAAAVLTILHAFLRPILKLISTPLIWGTLGLFNFVINMALLWLADQLLVQVAIADLKTLFFASLIIALSNSFF